MGEATPSAAERLRADAERQAEQAPLVRRLENRYNPAAANDVSPAEIMLDLQAAEQRQIFLELPPPPDDADEATRAASLDPNFPGQRVEAPPDRQQLLANVREAWGRYFDDPARAANRLARTGVVAPSDAQMADPSRANVDLAGVPSLEDATNAYVDIVREHGYRLAEGPDGLFPLSQRLEGTSAGMAGELARDRENWRRIEHIRRYQDIEDQVVFLNGQDKIDRMVELAEQGIAAGEYDVATRQETRNIPAVPGGARARTEKITRYVIRPTGHRQNRELAQAYSRAFNKALASVMFDDDERTAFSEAIGTQIAPPDRLKSLRDQGQATQEMGAGEARRAQEARDAVAAVGLDPTERAGLVEQRRRDRLGRRRERGRLDVDAARVDAETRHSEFAARNYAFQTMPAEFRARMTRVQAEMGTTTDDTRRDALRMQYETMRKEAENVMDAAGDRQKKREALYAEDPVRYAELTVPRMQARRDQLVNWFNSGGGYGSFDPTTDRFRGGPPGRPNMWDQMSSLERRAATPLLVEARQARLTGRRGDELYLLRQAAELRERAYLEHAVIEKQIYDTASEATKFVGEKSAEGLPGTMRIGRTTDEQCNADIVNEVLRKFGIARGAEADARYIHRAEAPNRKNGKPRRGAVGKEVARDNVYRIPNMRNAVFVVRTNSDGQLVSADIHVTEHEALRQAHGSTFNRLTSGVFTDEVDPALELTLKGDFEKIKESVSDPAAADRRRGATASIGNAQWAAAESAVAPYADYGTGYDINEGDGGLWQLQPIRNRLMEAGFSEAYADAATYRQVERPREGQPRRWWWLNAVTRDHGETSPVRNRRVAPGRPFPAPTAPRS
jgi:hypothetical protein